MSDTGSLCGFCRGEPVADAASWLDGKARPPAACPRCGQTAQSERDGDYDAWVASQGGIVSGPPIEGEGDLL
jgi:hypothetical protein